MDNKSIDLDSNQLNKKPRSSSVQAILLGLLTFFVTGAIAIPIVIIFLPFGINLALILMWGFWVGRGFEQIALIILFLLLGDFATAIISWFVNHSKKLARITFISALIFQVAALVVGFLMIVIISQGISNIGTAHEKSFQKYAVIGDIGVEPQKPSQFTYALNGKMTTVQLFKKLVFTIPLSVSHAGTYEAYVKYFSASNLYANSDSPSTIKQTLDVGSNIVKIEFVAGDAPNLGYEDPKLVQGNATIEVDYVDGAVNKFVGEKEIQF